jgi:hypothetical protein
MTSPKLSIIQLCPTQMIHFLDGVQDIIIWAQALGVVALLLRYLLVFVGRFLIHGERAGTSIFRRAKPLGSLFCFSKGSR